MKLSGQITITAVAALALGLVSAYGLAQPKPAAPAKKEAAPSSAHAHEGACDGGACGACAMGHGGDAGAACGGAGCMHGEMHCPMAGLMGLVDVKVEKTKTGVTLQLTAKDAAKVAEVQALAEKVAEHMKAGGCPMMKEGQGGMHEHEHGHEHHHGAAPAAAPARPTK